MLLAASSQSTRTPFLISPAPSVVAPCSLHCTTLDMLVLISPPLFSLSVRVCVVFRGVMLGREGFSALWRGAGPNINRAMITTCAQLVSYETAQDFFQTTCELQKGHWFTDLSSSCVAGVIVAVCASPSDVIRSRIMNAGVMERLAYYAPGSIDCYGYTPKIAHYSGTLDCAGQILRTEGPKGFYKVKP